jgi:hypothetical protein
MAALNIIGVVLLWGGCFTALYLCEQLRELRRDYADMAGQVAVLLLMYFNTFVAAFGAALMFTDSVAELEWHRTALALVGSAWSDLIFTALVMFPSAKKPSEAAGDGPDPIESAGDEPEPTEATRGRKETDELQNPELPDA